MKPWIQRVVLAGLFVMGCDGADAAPVCGDGTTDPGEQCDLGPDNSETGPCSTMCVSAFCGDGIVQQGESCDDGNDDPLDGCATCRSTGEVLAEIPIGADCGNWLVARRGGALITACREYVATVPLDGETPSRILLLANDVVDELTRFAGARTLAEDRVLLFVERSVNVGGATRSTDVFLALAALTGELAWVVEVPRDEFGHRLRLHDAIEVDGERIVVAGYGYSSPGSGEAGFLMTVRADDGSIVARRYEESIPYIGSLATLGGEAVAAGVRDSREFTDAALFDVDPSTLALDVRLELDGVWDSGRLRFEGNGDRLLLVGGDRPNTRDSTLTAAPYTVTGLGTARPIPNVLLEMTSSGWIALESEVAYGIGVLDRDLEQVWVASGPDDYAPTGAVYDDDGLLVVLSRRTNEFPAKVFVFVP